VFYGTRREVVALSIGALHLVCGLDCTHSIVYEKEQCSKMSRYIKSKEIMASCTRGMLRH
jgi:hypothetical protein